MSSSTLIVVVGMQRSGNHAVIDWLSTLFSSAKHFNNVRHDFLEQAVPVHEVGPDGRLIVSFEDSGPKLRGRGLLSQSIRFPKATTSDTGIRAIVVLRDPYNLWASRKQAQENRGISCPSGSRFFIDQYKDLVALAQQPLALKLNYNRWIEDRGYRERLCAVLGGCYCEPSLTRRAKFGGGSSFEGLPHTPLLIRLLKQPRLLRDSDNWSRLFQSPKKTLARFFRWNRSKPNKEKLLARWQQISICHETMKIFESPELAEISMNEFGFRVRVTASGLPELVHASDWKFDPAASSLG